MARRRPGCQPPPAPRQGGQRDRRRRGGAERLARRRSSSFSATATSANSPARLAPLVEAVEAGECDLAVAAFSRARRRRLRGGARLCPPGRSGDSAAPRRSAPISGQRAMGVEVLRATLPFASGYGMEIGITVDAVRAGFRLAEHELDLRHRASGRSAAGSPIAPGSCSTSCASTYPDAQAGPRIAFERGDPRDRSGNDRDHLSRLRRRGPGRRARLLGVRAALPAAGLGRARRRRDLGGDPAGRGRGDRRRRDRGGRARRDRDRQPARDGGRLGPATAASPSIGRWSGRTGAPPSAARSCAPPDTRSWCGSGPGWCSTPTSRRPRSSGCCATSRGPRGRSSARSTPGSSSS